MKVFVLPTMLCIPTKNIFKLHGWEIVSHPEEADVHVFTGGEDISPLIYGQLPHTETSWNDNRDRYEIHMYESYPEIAKVGICRGAQLFCALNDGDLIQDIKSHHPSQHGMDYNGELIVINSYHHQACIRNDELFDVIATPHIDVEGECVYKRHGVLYNTESTMEMFRVKGERVLGVQYHPELSGCSDKAIEVFFEEVKKCVEL